MAKKTMKPAPTVRQVRKAVGTPKGRKIAKSIARGLRRSSVTKKQLY